MSTGYVNSICRSNLLNLFAILYLIYSENVIRNTKQYRPYIAFALNHCQIATDFTGHSVLICYFRNI